jgi:hypothetical protein
LEEFNFSPLLRHYSNYSCAVDIVAEVKNKVMAISHNTLAFAFGMMGGYINSWKLL